MAVTSAIAAVAGAGATAYSAHKSASAQRRAGNQAATQAEAARRQQDREMNRMNQKAPNTAALMKRNRAAGSGGVAGTYLTGSAGAAPSASMLGRTTILGG